MTESKLPCPSSLRRMILEVFSVPLVFTGFIDWEILSWNLKTWTEKLGDEVLPFRSGVRRMTKTPQWEGLCERRSLTIKEFLTLEEDTKEVSDSDDGVDSRWMYFDYKYLNQWFTDKHSIVNAVTWKNFGFPERGSSDSTIWIGNDGAHTPCHMDSYGCNLVAQVYGRKQWILFPPNKTKSLNPTRIPYEESSVYSGINFYSPDPGISNDLEDAYVVTLEPGDVLFVPHHWWHYVENIGVAISINSWIPMPSDDESRLEEALVRLFISQVCKDLAEHKLPSLLNPNEEDLIDYPLSFSSQQIEICVQRCKESDLSEGIQENVKKKQKLEVLDESSEQTEDFVNRFKNCVRIVPKYSKPQLRNLLEAKRKPFGAQSSEETSSGDTDVDRMQGIINAFCHPEVISKVKDNLLLK